MDRRCILWLSLDGNGKSTNKVILDGSKTCIGTTKVVLVWLEGKKMTRW